MLDWLCMASERWTRANTAREVKASKRTPRWILRRLSRAKLVRTLRYVYDKSEAQRKAWNDAGISRADIRSAKILEHIPFTTGHSVAKAAENYFCVPSEELIHLITTSSSKGLKKSIYLTHGDFKHQLRMMGTSLRRFDGATRAAAMFMMHDPTWTVGMVVRGAMAEAGMLGFLFGVHLPVEEHIELIKEHRINCLVTTPAYLGRLSWESSENLRDLGVRYIHLGGQPWGEDFRNQMEQRWGAKLIDGYGNNECACGIASECIYQNGLHVAEVDYWLEVVEPTTDKLLPEGEEGELVITTISRRGMPLVRYRTGDLGYLLPDKKRCECGVGTRKMGRVRGRVDDMLIVGAAHNLYPDEIERAVLSVAGVMDYQLVIDKDGYKDVVTLTVEANGTRNGLKEALRGALLGIESIGL